MLVSIITQLLFLTEPFWAFRDCIQLSIEDWTSPAPYTDRQALMEYMPNHVAYIKSLVPQENLLEFHPPG
jgi:hypothetical protein